MTSRELLVADSFRAHVDDAGRVRVRGFELHLERFRSSVHEVTTSAELRGRVDAAWRKRVFEPFMRTASERIARGGAGFPRLELWLEATGLALDISLRPLPRLGHEVHCVSAPSRLFPGRTDPHIKGPNIAAYTRLNTELGAEALLLDEAGAVAEGATTAVVWWIGGHGYRSANAARVPSVTEQLIVDIALAAGTPLSPAAATPEQLSSCEVWALNALHGIRLVAAIDGVALPAPEPHRLRHFREALDRSWQPVTD